MSATNPETGTVTYTYSQSRLASKTDAKGQRTEYSYDDKDRVTQIRHYPNGVSEDTCQRVDLTYDSNAGFTYLAGRLATRVYHSCVDPNNIGNPGNPKLTDFTEMYGYSQAGQVTNKRLRVARTLTNQYQQQVVVQRDLDGSWTYDSEGKMTSVTYPAGSAGPTAGTYTVGYDAMSRPRTLTDPQSAGVVTDVTYGPAGELLSISGLYTESRSYNSRLQLTALNGVTFSYPGSNNGKIQTQYDPVSGETITYQYDSLNRLISAIGNGTWGQTYAYDGFGNLTAKSAAPGKTAQTFSAAFVNNQQVGLTYDANGNQLTAVGGGDSLKYDVENRLWWGQYSNASNGNGYGYSPSNERVYKSVWTYSQVNGWSTASEEITYWGVGGQRMGSYTLSATLGGVNLTATGYNVYFGSKLVRKIDAGGSATIVKADRLDSFGKFAPYGEERTPTPDNADKFATYYRDGDTGLDYAVNRYYASGSGRFLTADPGMTGARPDSPGSWNRFAYVQGDPMKFFDPSGRNQASPDVEFCGAEFEWWQCPRGIGFVSSGQGTGSGGFGYGDDDPFCDGGSQFAPMPGPLHPGCTTSVPPPPPPPPPPHLDCYAVTAAVGYPGLSYEQAQTIWLVGGFGVAGTNGNAAATLAAMATVTWQGESSFGLYPINNANRDAFGRVTSVDYGPFQINSYFHPNSNSSVWGTSGPGAQFNGDPLANIAFGISIVQQMYRVYGNTAPGHYVGSLSTANAQNRQQMWNLWGSALTRLFGVKDCFPSL